MGTHYPNPADIRRDWLLIDLAGLTLGRAASQIANILRGKHKVTFTPHLDAGDFVICVNADKIKLTGDKLDKKFYYFNSGFPGGMKSASARTLLGKKPEELITIAVRRMLPRSPLGRATVSKLKVFAGPEHNHQAQQPKPYKLPF